MNKTKQKGGDSISQKLLDFEIPQQNYILRKDTVETIKDSVKSKTEDLRKRQEQIEEVEKFKAIEDKILDVEKELGLWEAQEELRKAERELVNWLLESTNAKEEVEDIDFLKEKWNKNPKIKKKMIDLAMRYNPNKGGQ